MNKYKQDAIYLQRSLKGLSEIDLKLISDTIPFFAWQFTYDEIEDIECKLTTIVHRLATYRKIIGDD